LPVAAALAIGGYLNLMNKDGSQCQTWRSFFRHIEMILRMFTIENPHYELLNTKLSDTEQQKRPTFVLLHCESLEALSIYPFFIKQKQKVREYFGRFSTVFEMEALSDSIRGVIQNLQRFHRESRNSGHPILYLADRSDLNENYFERFRECEKSLDNGINVVIGAEGLRRSIGTEFLSLAGKSTGARKVSVFAKSSRSTSLGIGGPKRLRCCRRGGRGFLMLGNFLLYVLFTQRDKIG